VNPAWSGVFRLGGSPNTGTPLVLSVIAIAILAVSGWLGGETVHRQAPTRARYSRA
jgi:hypothetical protein